MALRLVVALPVGYAFSALTGICIPFWLPFSRADAAMAGIFLGLILWPVIFMASFGFNNIRRLSAGLLVLAVLLIALAFGGGWRP